MVNELLLYYLSQVSVKHQAYTAGSHLEVSIPKVWLRVDHIFCKWEEFELRHIEEVLTMRTQFVCSEGEVPIMCSMNK